MNTRKIIKIIIKIVSQILNLLRLKVKSSKTKGYQECYRGTLIYEGGGRYGK